MNDKHIDAGHVAGGKYIIACYDLSTGKSEYKVIRGIRDINAAEKLAAEYYLSKFSIGTIYTDSLTTVQELKNERLKHINREHNLADKVIRAAKYTIR